MPSWYGRGDYGYGNYSRATDIPLSLNVARGEFRSSCNIGVMPQLKNLSARIEYRTLVTPQYVNRVTLEISRNEFRSQAKFEIGPVLHTLAQFEYSARNRIDRSALERETLMLAPSYMEFRALPIFKLAMRFTGLSARSEYRSSLALNPLPQLTGRARSEYRSALTYGAVQSVWLDPARIAYRASSGPFGVGVALRGFVARPQARATPRFELWAVLRPRLSRIEEQAAVRIGAIRRFAGLSARFEVRSRAGFSYLWSDQTGRQPVPPWAGVGGGLDIWQPTPGAVENWASAPAEADRWQNTPAEAENWQDVKNG